MEPESAVSSEAEDDLAAKGEPEAGTPDLGGRGPGEEMEEIGVPSGFFTPKYRVELSRDGATWALWTIWREEGEGQSQREPELMLDAVPEGRAFLLPPDQVENELTRLRINMEVRAAGALKQIREQRKKLDAVPNLPADCVVHVAQSGSMAWMFLLPPLGKGRPINLDSAMSMVRKAGITNGVDSEEIDLRVREARYFELFPMAWGIMPREGSDGRVIEYYEREYVREPVMDESGNVDYREQNYVRTIQKDDVICDILPPVPGEDGIQVTGKPIKAKPVQPARPPGGKNTTTTPDGAHLIASVDGHLDYSGQVFQVKSILEIPGDVDYSVGNINVFGDIHIKGDVRENFTVRATGDVTIDGLVEAATIEADGNIIVTKGILGDNRALIRSKRTVRAKYLENCVVYAGDCVFADCIISSQIYSDNRVSVLTGRGTIIGGCTTAANLIEAMVIGTGAGRKNEVILGRLPNMEREQTAGLVNQKELQEEVGGLDHQIRYLERREDSPENAKLLGKLRLNRSVQGLKLEKLTRRLAELEGMAPDVAGCRLRCGKIFPVTSLTIGNCTRLITSEWVTCTARYELECRDIVIS